MDESMNMEEKQKFLNAVLQGNVDELEKLLSSDYYKNNKHIIDDQYEDISSHNIVKKKKTLPYTALEKCDPALEDLTSPLNRVELDSVGFNKRTKNEDNSQKRDKITKTLLYIALEKGDASCLIKLIKNGANLNITSSNQKTPLYIAAEKGNKECLILLLDNGANINEGGPCGTTPGFIAALKKHQDCLNELMKRGALVKRGNTIFETNSTAQNLQKTIKSDDVKSLGKLIQNEKEFFLNNIGNRDATGKTVFHLAVEKNRKDCLDLLIKFVSEMENHLDLIDKPNVYGHTPLYVAALLKNDCFALLKKHGANFSKASYSAAIEGEKECLENFIEEDIDLSYQGHKRCLIKDGSDVQVNKKPSSDEAQCFKCSIEDEQLICCYHDISNIRCFKCCNKGANLECNEHDGGETQCLKCFIDEDYGSITDQDSLVHDHDDSGCNSLIEEIFAHVHEPVNFINHVFDSASVDIEKSKTNKEKIYKVDFKILLPKRDTDRGQMHVFACLLNAMNSEEKIGVLNHIFCQIFLAAKLKTRTLYWILKFRLFIWYAYFICVMLYTAAVLKIFEFSVDHKWLIGVTGIFLVIRFLVQMNQMRLLWSDHRSGIYSMWTTVNSVLVIASVMFTLFYLIVTASFTNSMIHDNQISTLTSISAIVIIVLHNIEFIMIHLKFTVVGQYYSMFLIVLYKTLKAIGFLFLPILCFIIIFHLQFLNYSEFSTIFRTFVKTIVLMTGEFEYENTLHNELANVTNSSSARLLEASRNLESFYVRFLFLAFILLVNLVLLNLIIGLSVNNVAMAKKTGNAVSIRQKAEFCIEVEDFLEYVRRRCCVKWIQNVAKIMEKYSRIESPYKMQRSKFAPLRQKTFDSLDELVRNAKLSKKQNKLSVLLYNSSGTSKQM
ncbi:transient receptor potential channel pyrexia-like [Zophobas morio]|uniref:transient receptor potential channel pyrexia-like n=1 Tax=Zophobas morio TaxID=2755281 RepID=UPI003082768B